MSEGVMMWLPLDLSHSELYTGLREKDVYTY